MYDLSERERIRGLLGLSLIPDGTPGIRDMEHPCDVFEPGDDPEGGNCMSDGHYLCLECVHLDANVREYWGNR